jgi:hypothetical protein
MAMKSPLFAALALALPLAACASEGPFPSLAPRAVEKEEAPVQAAPPAPVAADPRLAALLAELRARAREGHNQFQGALPGVERAAASAGAAGSEAWVEAQLAVSRLEAARAPVVSALAELDALLLARSNQAAPTNDADLAALQAAVAEVQAMADRQDSDIDRLAASLSAI